MLNGIVLASIHFNMTFASEIYAINTIASKVEFFYRLVRKMANVEGKDFFFLFESVI